MGGSSPLARGLPERQPLAADALGIIPARAGFTDHRHHHRQQQQDHPRSRGVYHADGRRVEGLDGSSPLARGLLRVPDPRGPGGGIIPARAGFTHRRAETRRVPPDHPRSRGVYSPPKVVGMRLTGSSPLARGLRPARARWPLYMRIIPARAGFTGADPLERDPDRDHPRSRGVYPAKPAEIMPGIGSSPLARGLPGAVPGLLEEAGIIPARAGFTRECPNGRPTCGGSSPLARGLQGGAPAHGETQRIIPARAGFTNSGPAACTWTGDHPRSRGVYGPRSRGYRPRRGSSPLARGLPGQHIDGWYEAGIIPARAGFTRKPPTADRRAADHPRSRGVYPSSDAPGTACAGSSPLARGLHRPARSPAQHCWIIPARAGFTEQVAAAGGTGLGSSPLARGLRREEERIMSTDRIIPARAGFTPASASSSPPARDHPRSRGVYPQDVPDEGRNGGSSPLARGLPR